MNSDVNGEKINLCLFLMDTSEAVKENFKFVYSVVELWTKNRLLLPNTMAGLMVMGNQVEMINGFSASAEYLLRPILSLVPKGKLLLEEGFVKAAEMLDSYKNFGDFRLIITCFIYAPITSDEQSFLNLGNSFNKQNIKLEIVRLGDCRTNDRLLIKFIDLVNGNDKMKVKAHLRAVQTAKKTDKPINKNCSFAFKEKRRGNLPSTDADPEHSTPSSYVKLDAEALMKELLKAPPYDPEIDAFPDVTKMSEEEQIEFSKHLDTVRAAEETLKKHRGLLKISLPLSHQHNKAFLDYYIQCSEQMSPGIDRSYENFDKALTEVLFKETAREIKKGLNKMPV